MSDTNEILEFLKTYFIRADDAGRLAKRTFDVIERQAAEIERLQGSLNQALDRMEQVEEYKRGECHMLPVCEAAIEDARAALSTPPVREEGLALPFLETTPAMRDRLRELSDVNDKDDYDRVVLMLLKDFARLINYIAPLHDAVVRKFPDAALSTPPAREETE